MSDYIPLPKADHPLFEELLSASDHVAECERQLAIAKADLNARAGELNGISDKNERLKAVRWVYWQEQHVRAASLTVALFGYDSQKFQYRMRQLVGPCGYAKCSHRGCDEMVPIASRSARDAVEGRTSHGKPSCASHYQPRQMTPEEEAEREAEMQHIRDVHAARMDLLDTMLARTDLGEREIDELYGLLAERMDWRREP